MDNIRIRRSKKILRKRKKKRIFSGILFLFGILFSLGIISAVILRSNYLNVKNIKVTGDKENSYKNILTVVEKEVRNKYLGIFPERSFILFPKDKIKASVYSSFKDIKKVDFDFNGFNSVNVIIKSRKPLALWCNFEKTCYFIDEDGVIYSKAPNFSGNVFLKYYGEIGGKIIGANFLTKEEFKKISFFLNSIKEELLLKPISFTYKNDEYQINLENSLNSHGFRGGKIVFNKSDNLGNIFKKLETIIKNNSITEDKLKKEVELDYIDLRFGNKIYYKFK